MVSFVLSLMCLLPVVPPMAHVARKQIRERSENGDVLAVIALVLGYPLFALIMLAVAYVAGALPAGVIVMMTDSAPLAWVAGALVGMGALAAEIYFYSRWVRGLGRVRTTRRMRVHEAS
ncbi:DUF4190 domain-containing protein [Tsukamurella sp. PLM1]|uniref:DUF4190 domain-containing protein n=1 Tax=Tsukamurella sp. PLM1 TaxID=2929795 RepID=UPI0020C0F0D1|nr:DUF4190 domain-containing protein [Tsukamurella sp. PLM1]